MSSSSKSLRYAAQLNRARLSSDDFAEALDYLSRVSGTQDDVVRRALLTAAIVAYARPFTNNAKSSTEDATSRLSVSPNKVFVPAELKLHERLMSLRNEVVAHTEYERKPVKRLEGTNAGFTMSGRLFDLLSEPIDTGLFSAMCETLKGHCFNTMMDLNRRIVELENEHSTSTQPEESQ